MPAPTPPSTTNSSSGASPDNAQFRVVRKRNRVPLSCGPCRHRKLKCNRGHPCDNCTKRGDTSSCAYAMPGNRKKGTASGPNGTPDDMQNRIDRSENSVLSLMTNGAQAPGAGAAQAAIQSSRSNSLSTSADQRSLDVDEEDMIKEDVEGEDSDVNEVANGIGLIKVDNGKTFFASDAHWYAILHDIAEVKNYFANNKEQINEQYRKVQSTKEDDSPAAGFLFKAPRLNDKSEALATFPPKPATDRLVARYFNAYDPAVHIIHGPTFQKQYDKHWQNPNDSPVAFIGLLYAIMTLALQSYHRAGDEPPEYRGKSMQLSISFRRLTAQCLVLADIMSTSPHLLETMISHVQAEFGRSRDAEPGVMMLVGLFVKLAMRMGYHRDPAPYSTITPFQGEMRRRVWTFVRQADLLFSFQSGLPSTLRDDHINTQIPRNLYDDESHEDMKGLPPSRPETEATPMSYMIAKARIAFIFGKVADRTVSVGNPPSYEEIMSYDTQLREARAQIPPHSQLRAMQDSVRDPANSIMQRFGSELLYSKTMCILHRKYVARGRETHRYFHSRRACIDASMEMLNHQATLHQEAQPGGRLRSVKWFISSLTTHDFLSAAMVVCLDLYHVSEAERTGRTSSTASSPVTPDLMCQDRREEMVQASQRCVAIWDSLRDQSMEAFKASATSRVMLEKLMAHQAMQNVAKNANAKPNINAAPAGRPQQGAGNGGFAGMTGPFALFPNGINMADDNVAPEHSAAMTLGSSSSGGVSPNSAFGISNMAGQMPSASAAYPASMAGLSNEPSPERTGLTPQYSGPEAPGATLGGAASPFSQSFGQSGAAGLSDGAGGDIDWGAWDSYIQGTSADPSQNAWMNMDFGLLDAQMQQPQGQQQQQQPQAGGSGSTNSGNVFMGASTPQGGNMM